MFTEQAGLQSHIITTLLVFDGLIHPHLVRCEKPELHAEVPNY